MDKTPIFPLNTIVFPGGYLPLRIFEPRYLEMVKNCLKENSGFGIVLSNNESHYSIGTYCKIVDWEQLPDGLLGILTRGKYRFKINNSSIAAIIAFSISKIAFSVNFTTVVAALNTSFNISDRQKLKFVSVYFHHDTFFGLAIHPANGI